MNYPYNRHILFTILCWQGDLCLGAEFVILAQHQGRQRFI